MSILWPPHYKSMAIGRPTTAGRPTCHWGESSGRQACSAARSRTAERRGSGALGTSTGRTRSRPHATEPATARWRPRHRSVEERWSGRTAGRPLIGRGRRWTSSETGRTPAVWALLSPQNAFKNMQNYGIEHDHTIPDTIRKLKPRTLSSDE